MYDIILAAVLIVIGYCIIKFRKRFVKSSIEYQNRVFGFHFGEKEIKSGEGAAPFIGGFLS